MSLVVSLFLLSNIYFLEAAKSHPEPCGKINMENELEDNTVIQGLKTLSTLKRFIHIVFLSLPAIL